MACFHVQIKDLTLHSHSFFITALIIAKTERRVLTSRQNGTNSGVITFTMRDTKDHFINCTIWGTQHFIESCDLAYKIDDVISIYQATVSEKNSNSSYYPRTSSPFELKVYEGKAFIHRASDHSEGLLELRNQAIKSTSLALKLTDLDSNPDDGSSNVDLVVLGMHQLNYLFHIF